MTIAKRVCAALLMGLISPAAALAAQAPPAVPVPGDPYLELVVTLETAVDQQVLLERALREMRAGLLAQNADIAAMEQGYPGTLDKMIAAMKPFVKRHMDRTTVALRGDTAALLRTALTSVEAREAQGFYASPIGRRVMNVVGDNLSMKATVEEAIKGKGEGEITAGAIQQDMMASILPALGDLKPEELAAMQELVGKATWLPKLGSLSPQLSALQAQAANRPMLPEEEKAMVEAIAAVVKEVVASMPAR